MLGDGVRDVFGGCFTFIILAPIAFTLLAWPKNLPYIKVSFKVAHGAPQETELRQTRTVQVI